MTHLSNQHVILKDGRRLGYAEYGDLQGEPLFYCHGFPASRLEAKIIDAPARKNRWRIIAIDRPGYGLSDFKPKRRILDWPDDVAELAYILGISSFSLLGMSGGGPYALACAWRIPSCLRGVSIVNGLGPVYEPWAAREMKWPARLGFGLAKRASWLLPFIYGGIIARALCWFPRLTQSLLTISAPEADSQALKRHDMKRFHLVSIQEAFRNGPKGALLDFKLYAHPWGFLLKEINLNIQLWQGEADATVPLSHARYLAKILPTVQAHYLPNEGHFSLLINHINDILEDLRETQKKPILR
ncbi:alpha/beta fold hydrolase [Nitrosococcus oceani]|uniref:Alpha/beta hydrolase fold protein n=2 Tax=Nitrosococcus oceani TaxID=1229 RepID=Q3JBY9_NITOC|nr:alpha/beta hydrolase [Nitrosococcus oceani]KFI19944.1 alpha/beta hydrolase [Nitrosococcus oceani C-27]ABA57657.1 Alpha/beta hydrolase fold protein [Nitrosococcus oceani ATCC 19707]EDZ67364.1 hydrolase, alpha/beta fold family, putative [Nitrosococcus oceani AFC27]KFI23108.1 alpha/beta hydrolase [Nitrosococcus oceani]GEM19298.1 alpha/beta hydrolase [Nitrosococcus oceani]